MKRRRLALGLALALAGCNPIPRLRAVFHPPPKKAKPVREAPPPAFPPHVIAAFPEARSVRLDPRSPRMALAAERVLTADDPHLRRGPPRFSPDGRTIAYEEIDLARGERSIVVRALDGAIVARLPVSPQRELGSTDPPRREDGGERGPSPIAWAPSSDALAFTRETSLGAYEAAIARFPPVDAPAPAIAPAPPPAPAVRRIAGPPVSNGSLVWSPAGDRILFVPATRPDEIWSASPEAATSERWLAAPSTIHSLAIAPAGDRVSFSAGGAARDLFVVDAGPEGPLAPRRLTRWPFDNVCPAFSPDGATVAFYSSLPPIDGRGGLPSGTTSWSLVTVAADGSDPPSGSALFERVRASRLSIGLASPPSWSPDGRWIAVVEPRTVDFRALVLVESHGTARHELATDSITNEDVAVSADGVLAYRSRGEWGDHIVIGLTGRGATRVGG